MTTFTKSKLFLVACVSGLLVLDLWYEIEWFYYLIPIAVFGLFLVIASTSIGANVFVKSYTQPIARHDNVALTFDDGPDENTIAVLSVLKRHKAKATFFCVGHKIEKHPEIMKAIVAEGHSVGNHSYSHDNLLPLYSKKKIKLEVQQTAGLIEGYTGRPCQLFRPPFGVINPNVAAGATDSDHKVIGWNLRTYDTTRHFKKVINQLKKKLEPGSVVLLHDDRPHTAKILEEILLYGKAKGFTFVTVEDIFGI